jgi:predicted pyridoxine 5'-phosphate oxidase superfamily flavin-nucleotide-binding protein
MVHRYLEVASTPSVKAAQARYGSAELYADHDGSRLTNSPARNERFGVAEIAFLQSRDGFYIASASERGWPYVQYRGGPSGFLKALDDRTLGFADFRGNRQYITTGNVMVNDQVSLFLMDYAHRRRLKVFGRLKVIDSACDPGLTAQLQMPSYKAKVERVMLIKLVAFDWNCPQHITPRFSESELAQALTPLHDELEQLRRENHNLRQQLEGQPGFERGQN